LSQKETKNYINHRLRIAGAQSQIFSESAFASIWKRSRGVPRLINHICDNAMLIGYASEAKIIGRKMIKEAIQDMDLGHKNHRAPNFPWLKSLNWAGAPAAFIMLIALIVACFIIFKLWFVKDGSQEEFLSTNQSKDSSLLQDPPGLKFKSNIEPQEVLSHGSANLPDTAKSSEPKQSFNSTEDFPNSESPAANESKENLEVQEALSHEPEKLSETITQSDTIHAGQIAHNTPSEEDVGSDAINVVAVAEPEERIVSSSPPKEYVKAETIAAKPIFAKKVVKPNDNLSGIARKMYGMANDTVIDLIHTANPAIQSVHRIYPGQTILLPIIKKENLISRNKSGRYHIHYASFYDFDDALKCVQELRDKGHKSVINKTYQQKNVVYRVYYGNFASYDEARYEVNNLRLGYFSFLH
jgi:hypothetical protein